MGVRVRPATAEDSPQVYPLATELATSFEVRADAFRVALDAQLADPSCVVLVAEGEHDIVGSALAQLHHTSHAHGSVV